MKHVFLLDENILMRAIAGSPEAINLWQLIGANCHKVATDDAGDLANRYWARLRRGKKRMARTYPVFPALLSGILRNLDKNDPRQISSVREEVYVRHQKDHYLLRILANGGGHLVTTDKQLREDFNRDEVSRAYKINGLSIEEAIALATES